MRVQSRHNYKKNGIVQVALVASCIVVLGILLPRAISLTAMVVLYPLHTTNLWLETSSSLVPTFFRNRQSLLAEVQELENDLVIAGGSTVTHQRLQEENLRFRQLLGAENESRVLAAIIGRPDELPYDMLQIDRGSNQGIEVGSPVFIGADTVVGLVVHTASTYSFVELFTTPGFEASVFISGPNVVATMEGYGGGVSRVRVPQGVPISVGNLVYLPTIEPGVFGRISYIVNEPTQPEQYGYITPDIAISSMYQVAVGKQSQIAHSATEIDSRILELMRTELLVSGLSVGIIATSSEASSTPPVSEESLE